MHQIKCSSPIGLKKKYRKEEMKTSPLHDHKTKQPQLTLLNCRVYYEGGPATGGAGAPDTHMSFLIGL